MNPREKLKIRLMQERMGFCDGEPIVKHACGGGLEMHEAIYKRNDAVTDEQKAYLVHEVNCHILCSKIHQSHGTIRWFNRKLEERQRERYGNEAVDAYIRGWPGKIPGHCAR